MSVNKWTYEIFINLMYCRYENTPTTDSIQCKEIEVREDVKIWFICMTFQLFQKGFCVFIENTDEFIQNFYMKSICYNLLVFLPNSTWKLRNILCENVILMQSSMKVILFWAENKRKLWQHNHVKKNRNFMELL